MKKILIGMLAIGLLAGCSSNNDTSDTTQKKQEPPTKQTEQKKVENPKPLTPAQKIDKDLENIVITNVLELSNPKLSNITSENDSDNGSYEVKGIVSGVDQSGKKVEYDFSAYTDGSKTVQWTTEDTSTYQTKSGTIDTSNGMIK